MRIVLLGTGTGIGKTRLTCRLAAALLPLARPVLPLKPVETGFPAGSGGEPAPGSDAALLEAAAFHVQHPRPHPLFAFPEPISPHLAAERAGRLISLQGILDWIASAEQQFPSVITLIETAGGAFSPLTATDRNVELARQLAADLLVLVAPDRLGVLHDVGAATAAMKAFDRSPDCVALGSLPVADVATDLNAFELRRLHPELPVFRHSAAGVDPGLIQLIESKL